MSFYTVNSTIKAFITYVLKEIIRKLVVDKQILSRYIINVGNTGYINTYIYEK